MSATDRILEDALALNPQERAEVAHRLILSLEADDAGCENVETAWADEIKRRRTAIRSGEVQMRDWDEALLEIRNSTRISPVQ